MRIPEESSSTNPSPLSLSSFIAPFGVPSSPTSAIASPMSLFGVPSSSSSAFATKFSTSSPCGGGESSKSGFSRFASPSRPPFFPSSPPVTDTTSSSSPNVENPNSSMALSEAEMESAIKDIESKHGSGFFEKLLSSKIALLKLATSNNGGTPVLEETDKAAAATTPAENSNANTEAAKEETILPVLNPTQQEVPKPNDVASVPNQTQPTAQTLQYTFVTTPNQSLFAPTTSQTQSIFEPPTPNQTQSNFAPPAPSQTCPAFGGSSTTQSGFTSSNSGGFASTTNQACPFGCPPAPGFFFAAPASPFPPFGVPYVNPFYSALPSGAPSVPYFGIYFVFGGFGSTPNQSPGSAITQQPQGFWPTTNQSSPGNALSPQVQGGFWPTTNQSSPGNAISPQGQGGFWPTTNQSSPDNAISPQGQGGFWPTTNHENAKSPQGQGGFWPTTNQSSPGNAKSPQGQGGFWPTTNQSIPGNAISSQAQSGFWPTTNQSSPGNAKSPQGQGFRPTTNQSNPGNAISPQRQGLWPTTNQSSPGNAISPQRQGFWPTPNQSSPKNTISPQAPGFGATTNIFPSQPHSQFPSERKAPARPDDEINNIKSISAIQPNSHEELRWEDYQKGLKGTSAPWVTFSNSPVTGLFQRGAFGNTNEAGLFGHGTTSSSTPSLFGQRPPAWGARKSTSSSPSLGFGTVNSSSSTSSPSLGFGTANSSPSKTFGPSRSPIIGLRKTKSFSQRQR